MSFAIALSLSCSLLDLLHVDQMDHLSDHPTDLRSVLMLYRVVRTAEPQCLDGSLLGFDLVNDASLLGDT